MLVAVLFAILGFGFLIIIHESGHFLVARAFGIQADEFAIGMGPKVFSQTWGRTQFSLRAIPIGAFVMIENPEKYEVNGIEPSSAHPYLDAPTWKRFFISAAGPFFNFLLASLILILIGFMSGIPSNEPIVGALLPEGVAESAGLLPGDRILSINQVQIQVWNDISALIGPASGEQITILVLREGQEKTFTMIPKDNSEGRGVIGISGSVKRFALWGSIQNGIVQTGQFISETIYGFSHLFQKDALNSFMGPIGIVSITGQVAQTGFSNFIWFISYLSVNLGIVNLLPIPALDGGRLAFLLIEMIRGKKMNEKIESVISSVGFALIIGIILLVSFRDIMQLR